MNKWFIENNRFVRFRKKYWIIPCISVWYDKEYFLDKMVENYPTMSGMIKQMMTQLHNHVQILKKQGMTYTDISDLDIVKKHLDKLEDMF